MIRVVRETHETPADLVERVARAGGWNRFGEPNFRVVWGVVAARVGWREVDGPGREWKCNSGVSGVAASAEIFSA